MRNGIFVDAQGIFDLVRFQIPERGGKVLQGQGAPRHVEAEVPRPAARSRMQIDLVGQQRAPESDA